MFTSLQIVPDIDTRGPWTDLPDAETGTLERIGLLRNGTAEGRAAVALVIRLDDGRAVLAQTTWRLFTNAAQALAASAVAAEEDNR